MNNAQHDELSQLFSQLSTQQAEALEQQQQQQAQYPGQAQAIVEQLSMIPEKVDAPITFASAHYTGTQHIRAESEPSRSPPPPYHEALLLPEAMAESLRQNSIDPSALLPNQIELFVGADYEQRLRLVELWRISPPSYPLEQHLSGQLSPTSVQKEENEARVRYEAQMQARTMPNEEHMFDTYVSEPINPIRQPGEAAWPPAARMRAASIAARHSLVAKDDAEPYMVSGYEQRSDPVYAATGMWQQQDPLAPPSAHGGMEDQYGMYEQIRNHADWERMNQQAMAHQLAAGDDDMVM